MSTSSQPSSDATIVKVGWIQKRGMYICLYNKLSYVCILIGSHLCLLEDRRIDYVIIKLFLILYYLKQIDSKLPCICSLVMSLVSCLYKIRKMVSLGLGKEIQKDLFHLITSVGQRENISLYI